MTPLVRAFLLSVLFSLVFLLESEGAPSDGHRIVHEGAPGDDVLQVVLQGLSLLQEETRQEWKEALRLLEKRTQEEMQRRDAEVKATVEGFELRIRDMEKRVSALDQDRLECAGGRDEFDNLNGRLSRLEDCLQRALDECSPAGAPPTPASTPIPSTTSSSTSLSSHTSSSTSNATTNYTSASASIASTNFTLAPSSASSPVSSSTPSTPNTAAVRTSTPAPSPSEASAPQPSTASTAPPTPDPALRKALGAELLKATSERNMQEVERLLDDGADPNYADAHGLTPLMEASSRGQASEVSLLLRRGADVHAADSYGWTALHYAAAYDRSGRVVPLLVAAGARVDSRESRGQTPLHMAAALNNDAAVRALVAADASKTLKDNFGRIPLDRATSDAVRRLLRP